MQRNQVVAGDALNRHRAVAHNRIVLRQHHQGLDLETPQLRLTYRVFIEELPSRAHPQYLRRQMRVEFHKILRCLDLLHINQADILPMLHLRVPADRILNVPLHEEFLIDAAHIRNHPVHVDRRCQCNQPLNIEPQLLPHQVAHQIVPAEASAHHVDLRVGVILRDPFQSSLEFLKVYGCEGEGTGHLIVDSPAIQADAAVALLRGRPHELLDVVHLAAAGQPMHDEQNRRGGVLRGWWEPVQ